MTTTFPVVAPAGTGTTMLVADHVVGVADGAVEVTVLVPLVAPKLVPVIVTDVPTGPLVGARLVMLGAGHHGERDAVAGDAADGDDDVPGGRAGRDRHHDARGRPRRRRGCRAVERAVLVPLVAPKFVPVIVTDVPTGPLVGTRLVTLGGTVTTVKTTPLLATPPTVTTTFPVVAPAGHRHDDARRGPRRRRRGRAVEGRPCSSPWSRRSWRR